MIIDIFPPLYIHEVGQRDNQEDALYPLEGKDSDRLFILCDGMGGYEDGEKASQIVCQSLGNWFEKHVISECPFSDDLLREAIEYAYTELDKLDNYGMSQMGTTLALLFMHRHGVTATHIGDSRIYHIRPQRGSLYISCDHSLVFDLFQSGEISYEEMQTHPKNNVITRAMTPGKAHRMRPDIIHITDILPDDYFYLCSDGMLERTNNKELVSLFNSPTSDEDKRQWLIKATENNQDNHTAWIIHIKNVVREENDKKLNNEEHIAQCNAINLIPIKNEMETENIDD